MSTIMRISAAVVLVAVTAFCVFGFLAAPEAGTAATSFRLLYGLAGVASLGGAGWLAWPRTK
jgi:hypothetical protein